MNNDNIEDENSLDKIKIGEYELINTDMAFYILRYWGKNISNN